MSASAFVIPHDTEGASQWGNFIPGIDPAELWAKVPNGDKVPKVGTTRVFYDTPTTKATALSSLGESFASKKGDERKELVRKSVATAVKTLKGLDGLGQITVDASLDPQAAAVAAHLSKYEFTLKTSPPSPYDPRLKEPLPEKLSIIPHVNSKEWDQGVEYAKAQNLARTLMEYPANMITPTTFCERVKAEFEGVPNVEIFVRDAAWAEEKGMRTFLSVTHGTSEPAKFLEIHYQGATKDAKPIAFVGKGITFDSGGISLKPRDGLKLMCGDMGGAAAVACAALAIAKLKLPVNLVVVAPLTENMPGPSATKPGDIIYAMNGKSVEVDDTDAEGRLVLADALYYVTSTFKPNIVIDVATLTGAMIAALGEVYSGLFCTSDELWQQLNAAGEAEYDRFWRLPLDEDFGPQIYNSNADLQNYGGSPGGGITAALFLKAFVAGLERKDGAEPVKWAHIDTGASMEATRETPYQGKGMTGRPVRALVEYVRRLVGN